MTNESKNKIPDPSRHFVDKELEALAPRLAHHLNPHEDEVPEPDYFQRMQEEVRQKISGQMPRRQPAGSVLEVLRPLLRVAALIAVVALAFWLWQRPAGSKGVLDFTDIPDGALMAYLNEYLQGFDDHNLLELGGYQGEAIYSFADLRDGDIEQYINENPEILDQFSEFEFY